MAAGLDEFLWMAVCGVLFGAVMAFGIGANDVANAFASSVSAGSLTLAQAVVVASIFEFLGAALLGKSVTDTVRNKIVDMEVYEDQPEILMFGNLCALLIGAIGLLLATWKEYPVSTTHTVIAALIGFSLAAEGFPSVEWNSVTKIFISWVAAPTMSGVIAAILFTAVKKLVLEGENTFKRATMAYPLVVFAGVAVDLSFVLLKSEGKINGDLELSNYGKVFVAPVSIGSGILCAVVVQVAVIPILKKRIASQHEQLVETFGADPEVQNNDSKDVEKNDKTAIDPTETEAGKISNDSEEVQDEKSVTPVETAEHEPEKAKEDEAEDHPDLVEASDNGSAVSRPVTFRRSVSASLHGAWNNFADSTYRQDLRAMSYAENPIAKAIWDNAQHHDPETEMLFSYLQVFTACLTSFAHGANDVANAIGPVSAILELYKKGEVSSKAPVQQWLLVLGGVMISVGFILYGYKIIKAVGFKLTCITPSRGFCIQLAGALAVTVASFLQIPVSSTQCLVGATVGAGFASGGLKEVQWWFLARVSLGWVGVFFMTCIFSAGFFSYCAYSPSLVD